MKSGLVAVAALVVGASLACGSGDAARAKKSSYRGAFVVDVSRIHFEDGDTFALDGQPIRVLGIDTPEITDPRVGIYEDQPGGRAAAESTRVWITSARVVELATDGRDVYHRRLAHVFIDGGLLAERLLARGLAYENVSHFGDNGFPDLADRILRAAAAGPKPAFGPPYLWRRQHQKHPAGGR